jgi:DNA-binding NarL/FixJ family response regulator
MLSPSSAPPGVGFLSIVVADDHELLREGIVAVIARQPGFSVVGCATDVAAAFALVARHHPDLLLLDVFLGGNDGTHLVSELATCYPATRILALCAFEEQTSAQRFLCAGASGFLVKSVSSAQLLDAIQTVSRGLTYSPRRTRLGPSPIERTYVADNGR